MIKFKTNIYAIREFIEIKYLWIKVKIHQNKQNQCSPYLPVPSFGYAISVLSADKNSKYMINLNENNSLFSQLCDNLNI